MMSGGGGGIDAGTLAKMKEALSGRMGGLASIFSSIFTNPQKPYSEAQHEYEPWMNKAINAQNPFYEAGQKGMGNYQDWLEGMKDPSEFINKTMGNYQESPWAKYLQNQTQRAGVNAASASGLTGSTPFMQQQQQNAANISSQDMQSWLKNVLGVNTEYGQGQQNLMNQGFNAGTNLSNIFSQRAGDQAGLAFGKGAAGQQNTGNLIGGLFSLLGL